MFTGFRCVWKAYGTHMESVCILKQSGLRVNAGREPRAVGWDKGRWHWGEHGDRLGGAVP